MHPQFLPSPRSAKRRTVGPGNDDTSYANGWHHLKGWTPAGGFGIKVTFHPPLAAFDEQAAFYQAVAVAASVMPWASGQRSASIAALQPAPAAVTALG